MSRASQPPSLDFVQLLRLYADGWSESELADLIEVHPARIPALVAEMLGELEALNRREAERWVLEQLKVIDLNIEKSVRFVSHPCVTCGGDKQRRISCRDCLRSGYAYEPEVRIAEVARINSLARQRIKLLGLDKPPPKSANGDSKAPAEDSPLNDYVKRKLKEELGRLEGEKGGTMSDVALQETLKRNDELARFALERELELTDACGREAAAIVLTKCPECLGQEPQRANCEDCGRNGYLYDAKTRLKALDTVANAATQRIKLLGLHNKPPSSPALDPELAAFFKKLQTATTEELEAEIELLN